MSGYRPANRGNRSTLRVGPEVSRRLRAAGINISPAARKHLHEGVFVSARELRISVLVDLSLPGEVRRVAQDVARVVTSWGLEAEVVEKTHDDGTLTSWVYFTYSTPRPAQEATPGGRAAPPAETAGPEGLAWMRVQATTITATLASAGFWSSDGVTVEQASTTAVVVRIADSAPDAVREGVPRTLERKKYTLEPGDGALTVRKLKKVKRS